MTSLHSPALLLLAAAAALFLANSTFADPFRALWQTPIGLRAGDFGFERPLDWIVNDGLMAIFFFVVGMEIRREIHHGELSEWRRAALPVAAAFGGMVAPALIYLAIARGPEVRSGWGVPMATDIAFAVGVLTLLGRRVPAALRVLLLALAVIDDLGAILVIAIFYTSELNLAGFGVAAAGLALLRLLQAAAVRQPTSYLVPGIVIWAGTYAAGVHPTIAGVVIGLMTPVRISSGPDEHLIDRLHPWVAFGIMPVFALANAGVSFEDLSLEGPTAAVAAGVAAGLVLGKPLGILLACKATLALGIARLPIGLGSRHLLVLGVVAGIGFTMSLFIAQLAFPDPTVLGAGKLGVLAGTAVAGVLGLLLGRVLLPVAVDPRMAPTADDAEASTDA